ncbi:hypothetical protein OAO01_07250 [Oligoflexia bacterium]|nr:hypothetical protein [Oligoflexia bacterium]
MVKESLGIAQVEVTLAEDSGPNSYTFVKWIRPLSGRVKLSKAWNHDCLPSKKYIKRSIKHLHEKEGRHSDGDRLEQALATGKYQVIAFFIDYNETEAHIWCEGQSIKSGLGWLSHPEHKEWFARLERALLGEFDDL